MKKGLAIVGLIIIFSIAAGGCYFWRSYRNFMSVETVKHDPLLTVYLGGGNSVVLKSQDGRTALIVDTKMRSAAETLRSFISAKNIIIINTHPHLDHAGGNALYPGAKIISGEYTQAKWSEESSGASRYPDISLKNGEEEVIYLDDEIVHIACVGQAHTWNDVIVYFEKRKLLVTGDLVFNQMHPVCIAKSGTKIPLWIETLDSLARKYPAKTLIPGHGNIADRQALTDMKNYFIAFQDSIGNERKLSLLKKKYKEYAAVPFAFSFNDTMKFVEQEDRKQTN